MALSLELDAVMIAVSHEVPKVLSARSPESVPQLPSGPFDPMIDLSLEQSLRRWLLDMTGLEAGHIEQIFTFGGHDRDPRSRISGDRILSVAYLALAMEASPIESSDWLDLYAVLPWEDHRDGQPPVVRSHLAPVLQDWAEASSSSDARSHRHDRVEAAFGLQASVWDATATVERYDLLHEAGLLEEAKRDGGAQPGIMIVDSTAMAMNHRRVLAKVLSRLREMVTYRPAIPELLPATFPIRELQGVVEALNGMPVNIQSLRRLLDRSNLTEGTGEQTETAGRPAELFRFRT